MNKVNKLLLMVVVLFQLLSCKKEMHPGEYVKFIKDPNNGSCKKQQTGDWDYTFQYMTPAYLNLLDQKDTGQDSTRKGYVSISIEFHKRNAAQSPLRQDLSSYEEYQGRVSYYMEDAARDISILYGGQPLSVANYHFETNYNLTPTETMLFNFKLPEDDVPQKDIEISFYDRVFRNGIVKALFKGKDLKDINQIKVKVK